MGAEPIREPVRRLPLAKRETEREEVHKMLQKGVSLWSSDIVLVTKKDGSTRFCVDNRKLNAVTKKDSCKILKLGS